MHLLDQECSAANLFEEVHDNKLLEAVQLCYTETSSLVLDTLFKRYKLIEHFSAMRKYLLLGQGDLIRWVSKISFLLQKYFYLLYPHIIFLPFAIKWNVIVQQLPINFPKFWTSFANIDKKLMEVKPSMHNLPWFSPKWVINNYCSDSKGSLFHKVRIVCQIVKKNILHF